jgi:hypothetical protein
MRLPALNCAWAKTSSVAGAAWLPSSDGAQLEEEDWRVGPGTVRSGDRQVAPRKI